MSKRLVSLFSLIAVAAVALMALPWGQATKAQPGQNKAVSTHPAYSAAALKAANAGNQEDEDRPAERDDWFYSLRTAGNPNFTIAEAAEARAKAAQQVLNQRSQPQAAPSNGIQPSFSSTDTWAAQGPNPIVQELRSGPVPLGNMSGRVSALAIRSTAPYTMYLGGAQGGLWISSTLTTSWQPRTDQLPSLAIGAIALAPSNENIVYVGTGEGNLSGDSYFGNGVLKSTNAGNTFVQVGGNTFNQVSMSKIVVDPTNANHLYVATLRGRAGNRGVSPPNPTLYGIFESTDGGTTWTARRTTNNQLRGATDLVMDPMNPQVLYAAFWGEGIVRSTDGGLTWALAMQGLPTNADYTIAPTRFALAIGHATGQANGVVYAGFEWYDTGGTYHPSTIWKASTAAGASFAETNTAVVGGYCGQGPADTQCFYDNVLQTDPIDPNIIYALGWFDYGDMNNTGTTGTGGVYRSLDGGASWRDLGCSQHPDFHAIAIRRDAPQNILIGNDGGVWSSGSRGGRPNAADDICAVDWRNLNGYYNPTTGVSTGTNLQLTQFTSIAQHPTNNRLYGGAQDNGTSRKLNNATSGPWNDFGNGDGGYAFVDYSDPNFVYSTYYGISPYRWTNGASAFNTNAIITRGLNTGDRAAFYPPFIIDPEVPTRLYIGTFRMYRTDNRGDQWRAISPDLTEGCTGRSTAGFQCVITTIGATAGSPALYSGSGDGRIYGTPNANIDTPTWTRLDKAPLPVRPVQAIAVDRSNYRTTYVSFGGFDAATPTTTGHVFKTTDGGQTWTNVSGNLPDVPVNTLVLDPVNNNVLYAGTDVGPLVTYNGGTTWQPLGNSFPVVAVFQLDMSPFKRSLVAGTHGRGAWRLSDTVQAPALQIRAKDAGTPVGPNSLLTYTLTVKNTGNAAATGVTITDPIPANTTFVSADNGGALSGNNVVWTNLSAPAATAAANGGLAPGTLQVSFTVRIAATGVDTGSVITNDGITASSAQGNQLSGSPFQTILAPAYALALTPSTQFDGTRSGQVITYVLSLQNLGYTTDAYQLAVTGNNFPTAFFDANFTGPLSQTPNVAAGGVTQVGVQVTIPAGGTNGTTDTANITATSLGSPALNQTATIRTAAVTYNILLVDEDGSTAANGVPDVRDYYTEALNVNNVGYNIWDIRTSPTLPLRYTRAHSVVVWFTGTSYPSPLTPYEPLLATFLNGGGRLFLSGWDILDQAGYTQFSQTYLHVTFNDATQNDKPTLNVTSVETNTVTSGLGTIPLDLAVLGGDQFSDRITPIAPGQAAFTDDSTNPNAVTVDMNPYKVVFLAFPFEELTTKRTDLMTRSLNFFGGPFAPPDPAATTPTATTGGAITPTSTSGTATPGPTIVDPGITPTGTIKPTTVVETPTTTTTPQLTTTTNPTGTPVSNRQLYLPIIVR